MGLKDVMLPRRVGTLRFAPCGLAAWRASALVLPELHLTPHRVVAASHFGWPRPPLTLQSPFRSCEEQLCKSRWRPRPKKRCACRSRREAIATGPSASPDVRSWSSKRKILRQPELLPSISVRPFLDPTTRRTNLCRICTSHDLD